ncbi:MAG: CDP-alcohol phosphatidyltransferase family protein [Candidatus Binatia bacterium]
MATRHAGGTAPSPLRRLAGWGVHLLTASSAPAALLALLAIRRGDAVTAFWWMAYTIAVDAIDGTLARAVGVKEVVPTVDGARLDDLVDYVTYVIVPAMFILQMDLVPTVAAIPIATAVVLSSAYGFAQVAAKTADHYFTGFPSYWNIVVFYLHALGWAPATNAAILVTFVLLVFVPIRYVYPSRTATLRPLTVGLGLAWSAVLLWAMFDLAHAPRALIVGSLAYPAYYAALSLLLSARGT